MGLFNEVEDSLEMVSENSEYYYEEYEGTFKEDDWSDLGIDPETATDAKPGSEEKVQMLAARYAAGLPLWHDEDCCDHGPSQGFLSTFAALAAQNDEDDIEEELG